MSGYGLISETFIYGSAGTPHDSTQPRQAAVARVTRGPALLPGPPRLLDDLGHHVAVEDDLAAEQADGLVLGLAVRDPDQLRAVLVGLEAVQEELRAGGRAPGQRALVVGRAPGHEHHVLRP